MSSRTWQERIEDIINAADEILQYTQGMSWEEFESADTLLIKGILYDFVIIGEASVNVDPEIQSRYSRIPWRLMGDMRNVMAHEYFQVDLEIIWSTIQNNLEPLIVELRAILIQEENE